MQDTGISYWAHAGPGYLIVHMQDTGISYRSLARVLRNPVLFPARHPSGLNYPTRAWEDQPAYPTPHAQAPPSDGRCHLLKGPWLRPGPHLWRMCPSRIQVINRHNQAAGSFSGQLTLNIRPPPPPLPPCWPKPLPPPHPPTHPPTHPHTYTHPFNHLLAGGTTTRRLSCTSLPRASRAAGGREHEGQAAKPTGPDDQEGARITQAPRSGSSSMRSIGVAAAGDVSHVTLGCWPPTAVAHFKLLLAPLATTGPSCHTPTARTGRARSLQGGGEHGGQRAGRQGLGQGTQACDRACE
jgi:hypothetical protein